MSVLKNACYRDDALQSACRFLEGDLLNDCSSNNYILSLCDFVVEESGYHELPAGVKAGNFKEQVHSDGSLVSNLVPTVSIKYSRRRKGKRYDPADALFGKFLASCSASHFGLPGVYKFVEENWTTFSSTTKCTIGEERFFKQFYLLGSAASYRTAKEAASRATSAWESITKYILGPHAAVRSIIHAGASSASRTHRTAARTAALAGDAFPEAKSRLYGSLSQYDAYCWKGHHVFVNRLTTTTYTFTREDINRIERLVLGLAWSRFYFSEYGEAGSDSRRKICDAFARVCEQIRITLRRAGNNRNLANLVCRAFDVANWCYVASLSNDINETAIKTQNEKKRKERLDEVVNFGAIFNAVRDLKPREGLEVMQVYKTFPQPDFDYFGAAHRQEELYRKVRPYGTAVENENTGPFANLLRYYKWMLVRAFKDRHGYCPGIIRDDVVRTGWRETYPHLDFARIPYESVDDIDLSNTFNYASHGEDLLDLVADKAICPLDIALMHNVVDVQVSDISQRNQLLDVLKRDNPINAMDLIANHKDLFMDVKAEDKPEAKKPNGRWFFEAHTDVRINHAEYERSVAEYAKHTVGCMSGKSTKEKINTLQYITELPPVFSQMYTKPVFISFDLDKFSPSLEMPIVRTVDEIWANAFGLPHIKDDADLFEKGNVHYIKRNIHHVFPKYSRDFEGFSGRKHTMYHCAVMGYAVRRLKDLQLVSAAGRFTSLIDDGLLRLDVPIDDFDITVSKILEVIEDVYKMANLYISWDKTFVSSHVAVFLNEYYIDNTQVTPGIRAFLKQTNRSEAICPSILDDVGIADSTARGAISSGSWVNSTYAAFGYHVMDSFIKWKGKKTVLNAQHALACFSPVAFGGLGCSSMLNLSGSVATPTFVECIGHLRAIAFRYRALVHPINDILNAPIRQKTAISRFKSPLSVQHEDRTLRSNRAAIILERRLLALLDTPVIRSLLGSVSVQLPEGFADSITHGGLVPVEMLDMIYGSTLDAALSAVAVKFLRARTAYNLVPQRVFSRAAQANKTEAALVISRWNHL